jgi:uncharacterized protein
VGWLLRRLVQWRVGVGWYLLVLLGIPLVELMGAFAVLGEEPLDDLAQNRSVIFTAYLPAVLYVAIFTGMGEEPGWRGFALPRLQERHGPLLGTAVLSVVWGMWHLPNVLFGGWTGLSFSLWMALTIASTFIYTWCTTTPAAVSCSRRSCTGRSTAARACSRGCCPAGSGEE